MSFFTIYVHLFFFDRQVTVGHIISKKKHNLVDRHVDKVSVTKPADDEEKRQLLKANFTAEVMPLIMAYDLNKVF